MTGAGSPIAHLAMLCWIPFVLGLFFVLPRRRAVIAAFVLGWLFLPVMGYSFQGFPDYTKTSATTVGVLLGLIAFDRGRSLLALRPHWIDVPMLVWCLCPIATSLSNNLGLYDGLASALGQCMTWGFPYLIARATFTTLEDVKELALGLVLAGLVYVPLCWWEMRMSPQLHNTIYGFYQNAFGQTKRMGGWRPMVFMDHGLMVATFMSATAVIATWLWWTGARRWLLGIPMGLISPVMVLTAVLCKSASGMAVLAAGLGGLFASRWLRTAMPVLILISLPAIYLGLRASDTFSGLPLVPVAEAVFGQAKAESLEFRLTEEGPLVDHALERPIFGWGGWNRARQTEDAGMQVTDSLWVVAFGQMGTIGLTSLVIALLGPPLVLFVLMPVKQWLSPPGPAVAATAMIPVMFTIDSLFNGMPSPLYVLALGGVASLLTKRLASPAAMPAPRPRRPVRRVKTSHASMIREPNA